MSKGRRKTFPEFATEQDPQEFIGKVIDSILANGYVPARTVTTKPTFLDAIERERPTRSSHKQASQIMHWLDELPPRDDAPQTLLIQEMIRHKLNYKQCQVIAYAVSVYINEILHHVQVALN